MQLCQKKCINAISSPFLTLLTIIFANFETDMPCGSVRRLFLGDNMLTDIKD